MDYTELAEYTWVVIIPFILKIIQASYSNHFSITKLHRESLTLLKEAIGDDLTNMSPEKRLILEEALALYYKKELTYTELLILRQCGSMKRAIELYLRHRYFLKVSENQKYFEYKTNPIKKLKIPWKGSINIPVTVLKIYTGYFFSGFLGLSLVSIAQDLFLSQIYSYAVLILIFAIILVALSLVLLNLGANFSNERKRLEASLGTQLKGV